MSIKNLPSSAVTVEPTGSPPSFVTVILTSLTGSSSLESAVPLRSTSVPRTDVPPDDDDVPEDSVPDGGAPEDCGPDEAVSDDGGLVLEVCAPAAGARNCSTPNVAASVTRIATRRLVSASLAANKAGTLEDPVAGCRQLAHEQ